MRRTFVPHKTRRSKKLRGVRRSPEPFEKIMDVRVPVVTLIFSALSTCGKGEVVFCSVLVPIKLGLVKNDYFLHRKFESYRYQSVNEWVFALEQFLLKKIWRIYYSRAHCLANNNFSLMRTS